MKLGMVFEGGASRTIFSCGVADAFLEENIMPDYFIGVSAGIAFGLSYLSKQHGRNLERSGESGLSSGETGAGEAWHFLRGKKSSADHQGGLWEI